MKYITLLFLFLTASSAQTVKDTLLRMSDGISIAMRYYTPSTAKPAQGYPAIVLVHGYGGSLLNMDAAAKLYRNNGYVVTSYTVRGQGTGQGTAQSGGEFSWFWGAHELMDCNVVIEWTRLHLGVNKERVGIEGYSQGGLTSWGAACKHFNVRCAVPVIACPRLWQCVTRNNCHNHFMVTAMALTKLGTIVRPTGFIRDTLTPRTEADNFPGVISALQTYDMTDVLPLITIPIYMQCGWQDDLFPGDEVIKAFHAVQSPKKLFIWSAGHDLPPDSATLAVRNNNTLRFYDYWLKDNTNDNIMSGDSAVCLQDAGTKALRYHTLKDSLVYTGEVAQQKAIRFYFNTAGKITLQPPTQNVVSSRPYIQNLTVGNDAQISFRTERLQQDITFCAARTSLYVNSTGRKYQANVMLYDYDSVSNRYIAITRGCYQVRLGASDTVAKRRRIMYELSPQLYTIPKGHFLVANVRFGSQIAPLTLAREQYDFGHVPFPPQETVVDTLLSLPSNASWFELIPYQPLQTTSVEENTFHEVPSVVSTNDIVEFPTPLTTKAIVEIFTITGELIRTTTADDASSIRCSLQEQPNGIYFIRISNTSQEFVQRVVLHR